MSIQIVSELFRWAMRCKSQTKSFPFSSDSAFKDGKSKMQTFWTEMKGVLVCDDEQLRGTDIKDAQHVFHYTVPKEDFLKFLFRLSAMLTHNDYERNAEVSKQV